MDDRELSNRLENIEKGIQYLITELLKTNETEVRLESSKTPKESEKRIKEKTRE